MNSIPNIIGAHHKYFDKQLTIITVNYHSTKLINNIEEIVRHLTEACLIVVDNSKNFVAKNDSTEVIIPSGNIGFGKACNLGAANAKTRYLLFLNPDTLITPSVIRGLIECAPIAHRSIWSPAIEDNAGRMSTLSIPGRFGLHYRRKYIDYNLLVNPIVSHYVSGACMMMEVDFFNEVGGFDKNIFLYAEDLDICCRAKDINAKILIFTHLRVKHAGGNSTSDWKSKFLRLFRSWMGHYIFFRKRKNSFVAAINAAHLASGLRI